MEPNGGAAGRRLHLLVGIAMMLSFASASAQDLDPADEKLRISHDEFQHFQCACGCHGDGGIFGDLAIWRLKGSRWGNKSPNRQITRSRSCR